jgi:hypothetical protein
VRTLGPLDIAVAAPPDVVFDVVAEPYMGRQSSAMAEKVEVLERGSDMVLAAHRTPIGAALVATTVETVRFCRPTQVDFRLTRGPVPYVVESFVFEQLGDGTKLSYSGELGADLWGLGARWAAMVARTWERTVASTFDSVKAEAERRTRTRR